MRKVFFIGLFMFGFMMLLGAALTYAATFDVYMGDDSPPCGGPSIFPVPVGFVDCTSNTGGSQAIAVTSISAGDTVRWTMISTPHTTTSETALNASTGGDTGAPCGTGDTWNSGAPNAFNTGLVFTHTFNT